jgi:glycosyltransferase involved in cell wall biosynthesis
MDSKSENEYNSVSIILPALNEEHYINHCLESIAKLENGGMSKEVIVVDNGSEDDTVRICKDHDAKVLIKRGGTIASLRNYGAKTSTGDILAFLDADCTVPEGWLKKSVDYLKERDSAILGYRLTVPESSNWVAKCWDLLFVKRYSNREPDWIPSGNMIMMRKTFLLTGGFNEALDSNEDIDFCHRAREQGCKIMSFDEPSVTHLRPPESLIGIFKKELWHGKDVFRVFLMDVFENKRINFIRGKNFRIIAFSLFYLICIFFLLFSLVLALNNTKPIIILIALMCPIIASFFLAIKYVASVKKYYLILGMTLLIMIYGFSRGLGLLYNCILRK